MVKKAERRLYVFSNGTIIAVYPIALGRNPVGPKVFVGDGRTPEGRYVIESRNENSDFYRALKISYPNEENKEIARQYGIPPGGQIMIHGQPNRNRPDLDTNSDWTEGCIAVTNRQMDELWRTVKTGTPINILP
ncbi:MAG: L,D-transpeptidase family protein [Hyphomicrobiales bacterium]|nr:L,D-transpeptidase family protein [Hyphomicrobiales bacterium]